MSSILDLPSVRERVSPISVEEYHRQPEYNQNGKRTELIRGFVIEKMSKSPLHVTIAALLQDLLAPIVPNGFILRREAPLTLRDSEPEPDVSIVAGTPLDFLDAHPRSALLAIEVSVWSVAEDREKALIYAEAEIKEYWIILAKEKAVEVYRRPEGGRYREMRVFGMGETVECGSVAGVKVDLSELFSALSKR